MMRLTLGAVRASSLPSAVGLCAADGSSVAAIVNEAQERLLNDPLAPDEGWWGGWARMVFNVTVGQGRYAYITTPNDIARVIVLDVCQTPIRLRNGFYEFLEFGTGLQPRPTSCLSGAQGQSCNNGSTTQAYERDLSPTLTDQIVSPATIRIYPTDAGDVGRRILVQGTDQNGKVIYGVDTTTQQAILGEYVTLKLPFVDTLNQFTKITGFLKALTVGQIQVFEVDPTTGAQNQISAMDPHEVTAAYRRYLINGLPLHCCNTASGIVQVTTQVKFDYSPVMSDSDYTIIQSLPALIEECQAIRYSRMDSPKAPEFEAKHHAKALSLLFGQLDLYQGKTNTAIGMKIFGSNRLRLQPL